MTTTPAPTVGRVVAMGTVFNFDVRTPASPEVVGRALAEAEQWLRWVDDTFSTYKAGSEVSRFDRGELALRDAGPRLTEVIAICSEMNRRTDGYFDAWATGRFDPSGVVKGWSVDLASEILVSFGLRDHSVEGGGDIRLRGSPGPESGSVWRVGVRHPLHQDAFCAALSLTEGAIATSGTYERGLHVLNPVTGQAASVLASVTVVGPDLTTADAYATAALAMGEAAPQWLGALPGYESQVVTTLGRGWSTPGFKRLAVAGGVAA